MWLLPSDLNWLQSILSNLHATWISFGLLQSWQAYWANYMKVTLHLQYQEKVFLILCSNEKL